MTYQTPCSSNNPDDWYISRDGKQFPDDDFLTETEVQGIIRSVLRIEGETDEEHLARSDAALSNAAAERRRLALIRRRQARALCHTDCNLRTACLGRALEKNEDHGTWGGYFEEELREIRREIARRKRNRTAQPPE
jgi:hypothetical protein